jgi:hypothetical protein
MKKKLILTEKRIKTKCYHQNLALLHNYRSKKLRSRMTRFLLDIVPGYQDAEVEYFGHTLQIHAAEYLKTIWNF